MAAIDGTFAAGPEWVANSPTAKPAIPGSYAKLTDGSLNVTKNFQMIGQSATTTAVDTWVVTGAPDFSGSQYAGPLPTPLRNIAITQEWDT